MVFWRKKKKEEKKEEVPKEITLEFVYDGDDREGAVELIEEILDSRRAEVISDIRRIISDETQASKLELKLENTAVLERKRAENTFKGTVYFLSGKKLKEGLIFKGVVKEGESITLMLRTKNKFKNVPDSPFEQILQLLERYGYRELPTSGSGPSQQE